MPFCQARCPTETADLPHCSPLLTLVAQYFFNYTIINSSKFGQHSLVMKNLTGDLSQPEKGNILMSDDKFP